MTLSALTVEPDGEGCLVVRWRLETPSAVDIAVGVTPSAADHQWVLQANPGAGSARLTDLAAGRHYVSVTRREGGAVLVAAERRVRLEGVTNFRDLGGYATTSGAQTAWGQVFRSDGLNQLTPTDMRTFDALGIRAVYDLRGDAERAEQPNPMASTQIALLSRHPGEDGPSPLGATTATDGERVLYKVYVGMLANSAPQLGRLLSNLADATRLPAVVHCAGGKDRTGMATALLLSCLGVNRETVLDDYELSGKWRTVEHEQPLYGALVQHGVTPEAAVGFLGAPRWAMADALRVLDDEYGGAEPYLVGPAGVDRSTLHSLQQVLTA